MAQGNKPRPRDRIGLRGRDGTFLQGLRNVPEQRGLFGNLPFLQCRRGGDDVPARFGYVALPGPEWLRYPPCPDRKIFKSDQKT